MTISGLWVTGVPAAEDLLRLTTVGMPVSGPSALTVAGGLRWTPGDPGKLTAAGGLAVDVNPFAAVIPATTSLLGGYGCVSTAIETINLTAAHVAFPRRDLLVVRYSTALEQFEIVPVDGIPGSLPDLPPMPADALLLGDITVPAGAVTGAELVITQRQTWLTPAQPPSTAAAVTNSTSGDTVISVGAWSEMDTPLAVEFVAPVTGTVQVTVVSVGWATTPLVVEFGARIIGPAGYVREPAVTETGVITSDSSVTPATDLNSFLVTALTPGETYTALFLANDGGGVDVGHFTHRRLMVVPV